MVRFILLVLVSVNLVACQTSKKVIVDKNGGTTAVVNPKLTKPETRKVWVDDKIEDDGQSMTEGHWRYFILRGPSWAR
jgi:hypothetical protein